MTTPTDRSRRRPPPAVLAVAAVALAFFALPFAGLLQRVDWANLGTDLGTDEARSALRLSLATSLAATAVTVAFGLPLAWVLARAAHPGKALLRGLAEVPPGDAALRARLDCEADAEGVAALHRRLEGLDPAAAAAWRAAGFPVAVRVADAAAWKELLDRDLPVVRDAGFTEVAPGTCTAIADLGILGP